MKNVTNVHNIDLPIAVWLLQDGYSSGADDAPPGELISVTTLMKPTRALILQRLVDFNQESVDLADLIASRTGHALHDSIERAWTQGDWKNAMRRLRYSQEMVDRIKINKDPKDLKDDEIGIYLEQRGFKEIGGIILTGQLDFAVSGAYRDVKTTSTFAFTSDNKDLDYILQGSMYRYILPDIIWKNKMRIEFIFTDWVKYRAKADPKYPQAKASHKEYDLMSHAETEKWILDKLDEIKRNAPFARTQEGLIECTPKELWKSDDTYKYFSKQETANRGGRAQKSFDNYPDADAHLKAKGKGVIVTVKGKVKACTFCSAFSVCKQRKLYFKDDGSEVA